LHDPSKASDLEDHTCQSPFTTSRSTRSIGAGDITEFAINSALGQSQPTQTVEDCYNEVGGARGYADGFATVDFGINGVAGPIAAPSPWDAIPACDAFGKPPADDGINIPSLTNPVWAALEVALTPTTLGDGTPRPFLRLRVAHIHRGMTLASSPERLTLSIQTLTRALSLHFSHPNRIFSLPSPIQFLRWTTPRPVRHPLMMLTGTFRLTTRAHILLL
jgi:hypothetical protein